MIDNMILLAPAVTFCRSRARENEPISCVDSSDRIEAGPIAPTSEVEGFLTRIATLQVLITCRGYTKERDDGGQRHVYPWSEMVAEKSVFAIDSMKS